ncbi:MAG: hypothetical protein AMXMBFR82_39420 [Candidatus Hydrogenedentota bacterium]
MNLDDNQDRWTGTQIAAVVGILVAGLAVRLYQIDSEALWYDEISSYGFLSAPTLTEFFDQERTLDAAMLPVYFTAEYYWYHLVGESVLAMRLLSLITGMVTIFVVYMIGRRLYGPWAGAVAALCVAFSKLMIYQSQEIRMYAFVLLFCAISAYGLINATATNKKRWWACTLIANALMLGTHLFAVLFVGAQFAYLLLTRPRQIKFLVSWAAFHTVAELLALGWFMTTNFSALQEHMAWIYKPGLGRLFDAYYFVYAGSKLDALDLVRHVPLGIPVHHVLGVALCGAAAAFIMYAFATTRRKVLGQTIPMADDRLLFMLCWLILPPFALFFLTYAVRPCFVERYTLYSCFALYILAGAGIAKLPQGTVRITAVILLVIVMAGNLVDLHRPMRPDWRAAAPVLQELSQDGAAVYSPPNNFKPTIAYYGDLDPDRLFDSEEYLTQALAEARKGNPVGIAIFEVPGIHEAAEVDKGITASGISAIKHHFPGRWDVYVWQLGNS